MFCARLMRLLRIAHTSLGSLPSSLLASFLHNPCIFFQRLSATLHKITICDDVHKYRSRNYISLTCDSKAAGIKRDFRAQASSVLLINVADCVGLLSLVKMSCNRLSSD